ncbi:M20 family metallo-hydrolase [Halalkaliarchaeum sp. AArc-GB]|uniref:M20 family metallo-hydrolase n=1 Tax=Halalkaliarchaeum sp. AArc-GB TaxID=3074078 RepID=UPI00285DD98A|nr:M20 family metallo-hydrolase [Halalkaliarchaeum sp. AArc-GB]MDR5672259.1 M20 family metallo-hydrolase [Halalkaliarchaeum sp. AArc-GB]
MTATPTVEIDAERLRLDLEENGEFGTTERDPPRRWGRTVLAGTSANKAARDRLCGRLGDAGFEVTVDAVGNVLGTWTPPSADPDAAPVVAGSHLDSVPGGGIFDGPLGVYAALEAIRAMQAGDVEPDRPVGVVSFTEEEGQRFGEGLLGSSVAAGDRSVAEARSLSDGGAVTGEETTLGEALAEIGYDGEGRLDVGEWHAFLELHVEQDTVLEQAAVESERDGPGPVGVVTTITGITHVTAELVGEANHAGATGMEERLDALAAAAEFVLDVEESARELADGYSETAVGTVGSIDVEPNATNVVPGRATLGVDVRDVEAESTRRILADAEESLARIETERGVETSMERTLDVSPTPMSDRLREAADRAGTDAEIETLDLPSGAAHDAMMVARATDAALLFAPSRNGISHSPREWTDWDDCAAGAAVLAGALARLA